MAGEDLGIRLNEIVEMVPEYDPETTEKTAFLLFPDGG
jgi:hypothetical protein